MPPDREAQKRDLRQREETAQRLIDEFMEEWSGRLVTDLHKVELEILLEELKRIVPEKLDEFVRHLTGRINQIIRFSNNLSNRIQGLATTLGEIQQLTAGKRELEEEARRAADRETELEEKVQNLRDDVLGLDKRAGDSDEDLRKEFSSKLAKLRTEVERIDKSIAGLQEELGQLRTDTFAAHQATRDDLSHRLEILRTEFKRALSSRITDIRNETEQRFEEHEHQLKSLFRIIDQKESRLTKTLAATEARINKDMNQIKELALAGLVLAIFAMVTGCCALGYAAWNYFRG